MLSFLIKKFYNTQYTHKDKGAKEFFQNKEMLNDYLRDLKYIQRERKEKCDTLVFERKQKYAVYIFNDFKDWA